MKGHGQPLSKNLRAFFEPRFGHDFSDVRVHTGKPAAIAAKSINAKAFTTGKDVVFGHNQYSPGTTNGRRLLAHELSHVIQQKRNAKKVYSKDSNNNIGVAQKMANNLSNTIGLIQRMTIKGCRRSHHHRVANAWAMAQKSAILRTVNSITAHSLSARAARYLRTYFGRSGPQNRFFIGYQLQRIQENLRKVTIKCKYSGDLNYNRDCSPGKVAYVRTLHHFFPERKIYICHPHFYRLNSRRRMSAIVHEGAHLLPVISARDFDANYSHNCINKDATKNLGDGQRLLHADSYACLVYQLG
jgi:hypothetical protein